MKRNQITFVLTRDTRLWNETRWKWRTTNGSEEKRSEQRRRKKKKRGTGEGEERKILPLFGPPSLNFLTETDRRGGEGK